jgi:hypothetical protein
MDNLGPCRLETTVITLFLVQETRNAVHYQPTQKGAIVLADGVAFKTLSISVQRFQRTDRRLERLYTTAYNRLQTKGDDENDPTRIAD